MNTIRPTLLTLALLAAAALAAREVPGAGPRAGGSSDGGRAAPCAPATAVKELDLNNVRARIENGGTLWDDRSTGAPA